MKLADLKGKKITIMGLGLHGGGVGTASFLCGAGAKVIVTDMKSKEELAESLLKLKGFKNITYVLSQHRPEDFTKVDMVIKNPGVSWENKYIQLAVKNNVPVEMDSSLFFKLAKNKIIGVTGTKGKTTTSSLIYGILKAAGKDVIKVGVSQVSVLDKLKLLKKDTLVVFELSSWRLSALGKFKLSPQIAVITNIYPDHLNYYKSMNEYIADKKYICLNQKKEDICVLNADSADLGGFKADVKGKLFEFSRSNLKNGKGAAVKEDAIYFIDGNDEKKVMNLSEIKLRGEHNVSNVLAAITTVCSLGIDVKFIRKGLDNFQGVPHRLELVRELDGVKYYNDSAATTPESGISGLNAFSEPVILICGGSEKNLPIGEFAKEISEHAKGVIFLKGAATDKIISELNRLLGEKKDFKIVESMEKAVEMARRETETGDVILLSPGAASFGLFVNEFDRGNKFRDIVKKLK